MGRAFVNTWVFSRLGGCIRCKPRANLDRMFTTVAHITMMMVMEMPSPGHFVMSRERVAHEETGRLD